MPHLCRKNLPGFTLLEMSFVLIIAGLIMGLSLPLFTTMLQQQKQRQTQDHQEQVLYALAAFLNQHGCLPPPADPATLEQGIATTDTCAAGDHCQGLIPYRTLGLMESLAKDGYHRWMTYVTSKQLTETDIIQDVGASPYEAPSLFGKQYFCDIAPGPTSLQLLDAQKQPLLSAEAKDVWAVILISHGPQGLDNVENANNGPVFTIRNSALIKAVTRNNILAIYAHNPCQPKPRAQPPQSRPHKPEPDPDDWVRPLPKYPKRVIDD
ncbi:MAG: prepilin-type N-terminal cleavage/methylation domain-containing protein [Alphaproteobacteria bacterium]